MRSGRRSIWSERLRADGRLDGHLVQGHVDGIGVLVGIVPEGDAHLLRFRIPEDVAALTVEHGSITLNGVSLTVSKILLTTRSRSPSSRSHGHTPTSA